jgi:uncharacterized protein YsxB (DUF464 family)
MTTITITKDYIELEGHTDPIVCSSISTMIQFIIRLHDLDYDITGSMVSKIYKVPNKTLDTFRELIKELEAQYPLNVRIEGLNE